MEVVNTSLSPMSFSNQAMPSYGQNRDQHVACDNMKSRSHLELLPNPKSTRRSDEMTVLANGNVMKHQKSRQRRILSCVYCHSKKIKCSRDLTKCNNCKKLNIECKYFINERVSKGKQSRTSIRNDSYSCSSKVLEPGILDFDLSETAKPEETSHKELITSENLSKNESTLASSPNSDHKKEHSEKLTDHKSIMPVDLPINLHGITVFSPSMPSPESKNINRATNAFFPGSLTSLSSSVSNVLQAPIANSTSNITNSFFNVKYAKNKRDTSTVSPEDPFKFNLSSFTFAPATENMIARALRLSALGVSTTKALGGKHNSNKVNGCDGVESDKRDNLASFSSMSEFNSTTFNGFINSQTSNLVDKQTPSTKYGPSRNSKSSRNGQLMNTGANNSFNAYWSNPETAQKNLFGTNTYYENDNLLSDLVPHLPNTRERSFELIERYVNSVHILLPILVDLPELLKQHEIFWDHFNPFHTASPLSSSTPLSCKTSVKDFNFLQFYTLYFPVLYASTISEFEEYDNLLLNQDISKYLKGFNKICQHYNYPHGIRTIPLLLGNVIIQSTSPNPSTMEMSQIIRYAKFLQLHKDPLLSLRITDWKVIKFRRMLWWTIFGLDALSSHNFCLPPMCKFDDFNVIMPEDEDPVFDENGTLVRKKLNVTVLAMTVKFEFDRILSELVYHLHNGLTTNITFEEVNEIKVMIVQLFHFTHKAVLRMNTFYKENPSNTVQEMNLVNFIRNHSWSFTDRALMLLHKKILLRDPEKNPLMDTAHSSFSLLAKQQQNGLLSLSQYEDTFGLIQEANIIKNFDSSSISQLKLNQNELFAYENLHNNLIPSILHNLNDFLKYNDFIKFGRFNWYVKRTIPLDSIILLFVIICVKFKYEFMTPSELTIYVKLINKALFILNRKYFKNEKYKRMLSLTNLTWEYILIKHQVLKRIRMTGEKKPDALLHFFDHKVSGFMNMSELFSIMDVPQPALITDGVNFGSVKMEGPAQVDHRNAKCLDFSQSEKRPDSPPLTVILQQLEQRPDEDEQGFKLKVVHLSEKIYYDLQNNFVDIIDYCTFYSSLENVLHQLMNYISSGDNH